MTVNCFSELLKVVLLINICTVEKNYDVSSSMGFWEVQAASQEVMDLITALPEDVIALCSMTDESDNPDMHKYGNDID